MFRSFISSFIFYIIPVILHIHLKYQPKMCYETEIKKKKHV